MESHITKPIQSYAPPLDSLDSSKTLPSSPPNNTANLSNNLSPWSDSTVPDSEYSDYDSLLDDTEVDDTDNEEKEMSDLVPYRGRYTHWSQPWSNILDHKPAELPLRYAMESKALCSDRSWCRDADVKPSYMALLSGFKPPIVGAGLANLGNTCFLNAIMQCFTHTVPLLMVLASCKHRCPCHVRRFEEFCVLCALREHLNISFKCMGNVVAPWALVNNLNYFSSGFWRYQQEDAHEFLQCFLDKLENCWNDAMLMDSSFESRNIVTQVFGGRLVSRLRCCNCDHLSFTYEPSIDLSLEIEDADTLYGALDSFTKVEKIEDSEMKFTCENCKEQVSVEKQLILDRTPSVAAFHLKRFKSDGCFVEKIDKHVAFPLELDLGRYTAGCQSAEIKYDLYAVVVHTGFSSNSGHYYCFIRSAPHMWYKFDDEQVTWVEEESVLSQEAYILFYAKQGTPCFASFYETQNNSMYIPAVVNTSPKSVFDNMDASTSSSSLPSECQNDGHETNDAADEASTVTDEKPECSRPDERENEENRMPDLTPLAVKENNSNDSNAKENSSSMEIPCNAKENSSSMEIPCNAKENNSNDSNLANDTPTRPRSPSPEIHSEDPPDRIVSSPGGDLRSADEEVSYKGQPKKELEEDSERKHAFAYVKNSMTESRGLKFLAAMSGSLSEGGSANKKRGRGMHSLPYPHPRNSRHKGGIIRSNVSSFR